MKKYHLQMRQVDESNQKNWENCFLSEGCNSLKELPKIVKQAKKLSAFSYGEVEKEIIEDRENKYKWKVEDREYRIVDYHMHVVSPKKRKKKNIKNKENENKEVNVKKNENKKEASPEVIIDNEVIERDGRIELSKEIEFESSKIKRAMKRIEIILEEFKKDGSILNLLHGISSTQAVSYQLRQTINDLEFSHFKLKQILEGPKQKAKKHESSVL